MNKYIEIIRKALLKVICSQPYEDSLDEDGVIRIFDIVFESLAYINDTWADQIEYQNFLSLLTKLGNENNPDVLIMIQDIKNYHKSLLEECKKDPEYRRFDSFSDEEKTNLKWDIQPRFTTTNSLITFEKSKKQMDDEESARLANCGHDLDVWTGG